MSPIKKILLATAIAFTAIQFIQPARNRNGQAVPADFKRIYHVPGNVQSILQNACYDCHSNNTCYPWYVSIQPVGWVMATHIKDGKQELNFSEFGNYTTRRQVSKLKAIAHQVKDDEMPLSSYRLMHRNARLSQDDKILLQDWMNKMADSLSHNN